MIEYRIRDTSTMLKLFYVIFMNLHRAPYMIPRMRAEADHPQRYTEEQRYSLVQHAIYLMNKTGKINTVETGAENLPKQGGYMYGSSVILYRPSVWKKIIRGRESPLSTRWQKRWLPEKSIFFSPRADTGLTIKIRYAILRQEVLRSL